jgi:hypothetical protein
MEALVRARLSESADLRKPPGMTEAGPAIDDLLN